MKIVIASISVALGALTAGCNKTEPLYSSTNSAPGSATNLANSPSSSSTAGAPAPMGMAATATLAPASGSQVRGTVTFTQENDKVRVEAMISGLTPGKHGFHVHEKGDCSAPDAASAGGHFNPTGMPHAAPEDPKRHMGDLGNLEADASGNAKYSMVVSDLKLDGDHSIIGKAVIVHEKADDLKTQPSGESGSRVACGVIAKK